MYDGVLKAAEILNTQHPLHVAFVHWCKRTYKDGPLTKRRARRFLRVHSMYRLRKVA